MLIGIYCCLKKRICRRRRRKQRERDLNLAVRFFSITDEEDDTAEEEQNRVLPAQNMPLPLPPPQAAEPVPAPEIRRDAPLAIEMGREEEAAGPVNAVPPRQQPQEQQQIQPQPQPQNAAGWANFGNIPEGGLRRRLSSVAEVCKFFFNYHFHIDIVNF